MAVFETEVTGIGVQAALFEEEKMIILFGDNAPETLADYCYNIRVVPLHKEIDENIKLSFDGQSYQVTAVGEVVKKNLEDLGHITIKFDGSKKASLAGTLYVEEKPMPKIHIGTIIKLY